MSQEASTEEEQIRAMMTRSSFANAGDEYREADLDAIVQWYAPDAISMPSGHHALFGHDQIRAWYAKRTGEGHDRSAIADVDSVDVVGDLAIVVGTFRVTRAPEEGVAALDHGGRFLSVLRRVDGQWRMWRDMDTTSPDADKYYLKQPRGW